MKKPKINKKESFLVLTRDETTPNEKQKMFADRSLIDFKNKATNAALQYVHIGAVELQTQLTFFLNKMDIVVQKMPAKVGGFFVDSVEISVEITAKGSVGLLGTGGEVGGSGGLKFTLKRNPTSEA
jgi:hypothetical protein